MGDLGRRIRGELLERSSPEVGWSVLALGALCAVIWAALSYLFPGVWSDRLLVAAVGCGLWGAADLASRRLPWAAVALRAAVFVFLLGAAVWLLLL